MKYEPVRLTKVEFEQVKRLKPGDHFRHVNLQHYGIPYELIRKKYYSAVEILKHGVNNGIAKAPELAIDHLIKLQLLDLKHSIPIKAIPKIYTRNSDIPLILHNKNGIPDSLADKYGPVMNLSKEYIDKILCYMREFKIVE